MKSQYRAIDHHTTLPSSSALEGCHPHDTRVIAVMPLACQTPKGACFYPNVQTGALRVAFQLARMEIERTLSHDFPALTAWFKEQGSLWPLFLKQGAEAPGDGFEVELERVKELVRVVLEVDHQGSFWNFLSDETKARLPSHSRMKRDWSSGTAPLITVQDLNEWMHFFVSADVQSSPYTLSDIPVISEFEVKSRWDHYSREGSLEGINFPRTCGFSPLKVDNGPNCKGVSAAYLALIAERFRPDLIYRVSEEEMRRTPGDHLVGRVTATLNEQGRRVFNLAWPDLAARTRVEWYYIQNLTSLEKGVSLAR